MRITRRQLRQIIREDVDKSGGVPAASSRGPKMAAGVTVTFKIGSEGPPLIEPWVKVPGLGKSLKPMKIADAIRDGIIDATLGGRLKLELNKAGEEAVQRGEAISAAGEALASASDQARDMMRRVTSESLTRRQLRQIIKEQVHLLREGPEKERLEALVAESPDDRAMGSAKIRGSLDMAKTIATERAAVALSEKLKDPVLGDVNLPSRRIAGAVEDEVFYVVVEVS